jgi:hypothetical protein
LGFIAARYPEAIGMGHDRFRNNIEIGLARHGVELQQLQVGATQTERVWLVTFYTSKRELDTVCVNIGMNPLRTPETCNYLVWRIEKYIVEGE